MEELTIIEYKKREEAWFARNKEYFSKYIEINETEKKICAEKYNNDVDLYLVSEDAKTLDKQREQLKEEYKGYVDHYMDPKFYCVITTANDIEEVIESDNTKKWMKKSINDIGKVMTNGSSLTGKYVGIAVAIDDFYYLLKDEKSGKINWDTCVDEIFPYKKPKSFNIVTNGKDYL